MSPYRERRHNQTGGGDRRTPPPRSSAGAGVDAWGGPVIDPTKNVLDLVKASVERIDDMAELRAELHDEQITRMERESTNQEKIAVLRAEHNREIRHMESDRVDKIRSVDVANAAATAAQLLSAVTTLATTAQATAETLRNQVAATAAAVASQTERVVNPIIERLALLEKSSNFGQGRAMVSDPAIDRMAAVLESLTKSQALGAGKNEGVSLAWVVLIGGVGLLSSLLGIAAVLYAVLKP